MKVKLINASNPKVQSYIGKEGELSLNRKGGYLFEMDNEISINTNTVACYTLLGDVDDPKTQTISFRTYSGSEYDFNVIRNETAQKKKNKMKH